EPDARSDRAQPLIEHLILEREVSIRKTAGPVERVATVRRVVRRQVRRIGGFTTWQEFAKLTEVSRPGRRIRPVNGTDRATNRVGRARLDGDAEAPQPVGVGYTVGIDKCEH